jgi:hypothetical protein
MQYVMRAGFSLISLTKSGFEPISLSVNASKLPPQMGNSSKATWLEDFAVPMGPKIFKKSVPGGFLRSN